ncbi:histidinol dehydrogenase [Congregibacter litoralis]|uniref:Histidinol dehydrogenase n=1 Tax=Congregibacter litoralis KT71 TaxID=314285 RepID=A4A5D5_9GAMM|nr:histidinol dehydrogenase [Congregibacter litoralis]EAQ99006.1 histidinol dehydrogenase [Congregibacter litoralis KT71]
MRRLDSSAADFASALTQLEVPMESGDSDVVSTVAQIIADVRQRGDEALLEYTRRFDHLDVEELPALEVPREELEEALQALPEEQRAALTEAARRIETFHRRQLGEDWSYDDGLGNRLGQRVTPLKRVGVYVPGGKASYPSSVLMNAIPARVAGVSEIVMVAPTPGGERNALVMAAAALAGVDRVFCIGGAQAVAALAYGTEAVPRVDKIVGPGNRFVAEAKRQVFGQVGIDMIAGPSEILIIADGSADPEWMAMDLFSQAEHDESAQALLLCPDAAYIDAVDAAIDRLLPQMERAAIIEASLARRGALIKTRDIADAAAISNGLAPEHLELAVADPEALLPHIEAAGAIFMGVHSCEALGDYCAGPNHVLPTSGSARFFSPLGVYDFQKRSSIIHCSAEGAAPLARIATVLAEGESLTAHARSAAMRSGE